MNISSVGHSFAAVSFANRPRQKEADKLDDKKPQGDAMLLPEQIKQIKQIKQVELKARDCEARAHEMAHLAAAG